MSPKQTLTSPTYATPYISGPHV